MNFETQNITKSFGEKQVLKDVNLQAQSGKALGLLGATARAKQRLSELLWAFFRRTEEKCLWMGSRFAAAK